MAKHPHEDALPDFVKELPADADALPDYATELPPEAVAAAPPPGPEDRQGAFMTFLARAMNAAAPGRNPLNGLIAEKRSMKAAGVNPSLWSLNPFPAVDKQPTADDVAKYRAQVDAEQAQAGVDHPAAAGLGNVFGTAASMAALPVGAAFKTIGPFAGAVGKTIPSLARVAMPLAKAGAGAVLGAGQALYKGETPTAEGMAVGGLGVAAPALTGLAAVGSAVAPSVMRGVAEHATSLKPYADAMPDTSAEEAWTTGLGGAGGIAAGGALQGIDAVRKLSPWLKSQAERSGAKHIFGQKLAEIRKAGGHEGALSATRRALDEGVLQGFDTSADTGGRAVDSKASIGRENAAGLDALSEAMSPEQQARLRPFVVAAAAKNDVMPDLESVAAHRPLIPKALEVVQNIKDAGGTEQKPWTFRGLNEQKTAVNDRGYAAPNASQTDFDSARVYRDVGRSMNNHLETLGDEVSSQAGSEAFAKWLQDKARYGDMSKVADAGDAAMNKALANRGISMSDMQVATGGGVNMWSLAKAFINKQLRERGQSTLAVGLDKLGNLGAKLPDVFGESAPVRPGNPPAAPAAPRRGGTVDVLAPAGERLFRDYGDMSPEQIETLGRAQGMQQKHTNEMMDSGRSLPTHNLIDPESGALLREHANLSDADFDTRNEWIRKAVLDARGGEAVVPPDEQVTQDAGWRDRARMFDADTNSSRRRPPSVDELLMDKTAKSKRRKGEQ